MIVPVPCSDGRSSSALDFSGEVLSSTHRDAQKLQNENTIGKSAEKTDENTVDDAAIFPVHYRGELVSYNTKEVCTFATLSILLLLTVNAVRSFAMLTKRRF